MIDDDNEEEEEYVEPNKFVNSDGKLDFKKVDPELLSKMSPRLIALIRKQPTLYEKYNNKPSLIEDFEEKKAVPTKRPTIDNTRPDAGTDTRNIPSKKPTSTQQQREIEPKDERKPEVSDIKEKNKIPKVDPKLLEKQRK